MNNYNLDNYKFQISIHICKTKRVFFSIILIVYLIVLQALRKKQPKPNNLKKEWNLFGVAHELVQIKNFSQKYISNTNIFLNLAILKCLNPLFFLHILCNLFYLLKCNNLA